MKKLTIILLSASAIFSTANSLYAQDLNVQSVISATKSAAARDKRLNSDRERKFKSTLSKEKGRLNGMKNERARQERLSNELENRFNTNEVVLEKLRTELATELGDLKELFGTIQTTASEAQEDYKTSLVSAQYPTRAEDLRQLAAKLGALDDLVSIDEIEEIWFQLQNEMTQHGKIVKFNKEVNVRTGEELKEDGSVQAVFEKQNRSITRVGVFSAVSGDDIVTYDNEKGLALLDRQMTNYYTSKSNNLQDATDGFTPFLIDPAKGGLLKALVRKPSLFEKVQEGKIVGYIIITLGLIALAIAAFKIFVLSGVETRVKRQARNIKKPSLNNPLGRVIQVYQSNSSSDPESMELKLAEAILKETPKLNSWIMFIKIIAVVSPLLGLLGTVTGMIQTFQAITLFGAGDPQMMAGGISQALVTTVLGLVVAIPTVFLHWLASGRARNVESILEEVSAGLVAEQIEKKS